MRERDRNTRTVVSHQIVAAARGENMMVNAVWGRGCEGVMAKDPTAAYIRGRNHAWLKFKKT